MKNAEWIWISGSACPNEYGEFYSSFDYSGGRCLLRISADSNYAVYLNGTLASFGQYADFPHDKVYDTVDITDKCKTGKNHLAIVVWYYGIDTTQVYALGNAALMFELEEDGVTVLASSEKILSRKSTTYVNHKRKIITGQLGFSFDYDATKADGWMMGELSGFSESVVVPQSLPLRERPCKKLELGRTVYGKPIKRIGESKTLYDLGVNTVGFLYIKAKADAPVHITVSYGEHITDGSVRRLVGGRDFSVELTVGGGITSYMNPFRRLGCKYLEVECDGRAEILDIGIAPTTYPLSHMPMPALTDSEKQIYEACVRTLTLCMHEHYEDCPWREQALYAMDSRNQMLCGYYAFGEYTFPRASLELMSKDNRADGLLSICYPVSRDLVIPSFSLHYFTECREYMDYSGDKEFIKQIYPKLESVLGVFLALAPKGEVVPPFERGGCYWNFYEWSDGLDGRLDLSLVGKGNGDHPLRGEPDIILNTLLILALRNMAKMADAIGKRHSYAETADALCTAVRKHFFDESRGLYADRREKKTYSVLGNSLAVLAGLCEKEEAADICERLIDDKSLTPISLSMRCFLNDALLSVDKEKYAPYILSETERIYRPMVDMGVGTVWETELGEADFSDAGSLCHGWSALPIYYYHILKK